ncbi:MAG: hypothetical protein V2B14_01240 [bacterium]
MSISVEKLIQELNSLPNEEQEKIIKNVPWLKNRLIDLIQRDLISIKSENIFDEITQIREFLYFKYGEMPDCIDYIREDRSR